MSSSGSTLVRINRAWAEAVEEVRGWKQRYPFSCLISLTAVSSIVGVIGGVAVLYGFSDFLVAVSAAGVMAAVSISFTTFLCAFVLRSQKRDGQWLPEKQEEPLKYERAELLEL